MNLTPEQQEVGRRGFLRALAGTPALAALAGAAAVRGPVPGGPVRLGFVGVGGQGRVLLENTDPAFGEIRAMADINPGQLSRADEALRRRGLPPAHHYEDWKEMLQKEDIEAVIMAPPLWMHADIATGCLDAGRHVLCEKMMAWDEIGCERMIAAAQKNRRLLEIGHQRFYNPSYRAAYEGIVRAGLLGDVYHARLVWHRNGNWRRKGEPPSPGYDASRWGYPTYEHLINWRLYRKYSQGLPAELASHQTAITDWFFDSRITAVQASGALLRWKNESREVPDHVYVTFEYPLGRTALFTSIESNSFDHYSETILGTKGTLVLRGESEAYFFEERNGKADSKPTTVEATVRGTGPVLEASESRTTDAAGRSATGIAQASDRLAPYRLEISGFCGAIRAGVALRCGPERALHSARACIRANEAMEAKKQLVV